MRSRIVGALLVAAGAQTLLSTATAVAATPCLNEVEQGNRWHQVPPPPVADVVSLVQLDGDPCSVVAADARTIWASSDGGREWRCTYRTDTDRKIVRLFAELQGPRRVLAMLEPRVPDDRGAVDTGILVSHDRGATFHETSAPGFAAFEARAAGGEPLTNAGGDSWRLYLAGRPMGGETASSGTVFAGSAGGSGGMSFAPDAASAAFAPTSIAVDPAVRGSVWANDVSDRGDGATRLWHATSPHPLLAPIQSTARVWQPVSVPVPGVIHDVVFSLAPSDRGEAARSALLLATDYGVLRSADDGTTWQMVHSGVAAQGVRAEAGSADVLMAILDGKPHRGVLPGPLRRDVVGLPEDCVADDLRRDAGVRFGATTFLLRCQGSVTYYRYRAEESPPPQAVPVAPQPPPPPTLPTLPDVVPLPGQPPSPPAGVVPPLVPMPALRTVELPGGDTQSGNIAFLDGILYYTDGYPGAPWSDEHILVHRVDVASGLSEPDLVVHAGPNDPGDLNDWTGVYADPRRNLLYVETLRGGRTVGRDRYTRMLAYDLATHETRHLFHTPNRLSTDGGRDYPQFNFDVSLDQFVAPTEMQRSVYHYLRDGTPADDGCETQFGGRERFFHNIITTGLAAGDGGGFYLEMEDDSTLVRFDRSCRVVAAYTHRAVSEAGIENDALACDPTTFGVPAMWIRDAALNTATAHALPFGFCAPMTSVPLPRKPVPGVVPPPVTEPVPAPQPQPQPQPQPVQQPVPQLQVQPQAQAQAQANANAQAQAQGQTQQQAQQQAQAGLVRQRQEQAQLAGVQVGVQAPREQYAMSRARRRGMSPGALPTAAAAVLLGVYGVLLGRRWQLDQQHQG